MTPGVTAETVDGMSLTKTSAIIGTLRDEKYRWRPVKRVYIPKKAGEVAPAGQTTAHGEVEHAPAGNPWN